MTVAAVVFDLDGVIVDSEPWWDDARRSVATRARRPWPSDATRVMQGMSTAEWSRYLADTVGVPGTPEEIAEAVVSDMARRYRDRVPLLHGAVGAVRRMAARWPLGLASSSPPTLITVVLDAAGLAGAFPVAVSTEQVPAGKPSPDVYREVTSRLGVDPTHAVAVEDSSNGIRSAHAAGLAVIAVPRPKYPPSADAQGMAARVLTDLTELTPDAVTAAAG